MKIVNKPYFPFVCVTVFILISSICSICGAKDDGEKALPTPCNLNTRRRTDRQLFPNPFKTRPTSASTSNSKSKLKSKLVSKNDGSFTNSIVKKAFTLPKTLSLLMNKRLWFTVAVVELIYAFISAIDGIFGIIEKTGVLYDYITDPIEDSPDTITSIMRVVDTLQKIFKMMTSDDTS